MQDKTLPLPSVCALPLHTGSAVEVSGRVKATDRRRVCGSLGDHETLPVAVRRAWLILRPGIEHKDEPDENCNLQLVNVPRTESVGFRRQQEERNFGLLWLYFRTRWVSSSRHWEPDPSSRYQIRQAPSGEGSLQPGPLASSTHTDKLEETMDEEQVVAAVQRLSQRSRINTYNSSYLTNKNKNNSNTWSYSNGIHGILFLLFF